MDKKPNKKLGQHWLFDDSILDYIADQAEIKSGDQVLEIGPGLGTLTKVLLGKKAKVIAVEVDKDLAKNLQKDIIDDNLVVLTQDIRKFNINELPHNYIVVANIPYYLTSVLIRLFSESDNKPTKAVILVQKEVAKRVCAKPGAMSLLSVSTQVYFDCSLGNVVQAELFTPPPKVDSQLLVLTCKAKPFIEKDQEKEFFKVVKAGFSERRKKLRSSLSGGLNITKEQADKLLQIADINPDLRAQNLSLDDWQNLCTAWQIN
jgi:16S rRNA (adenine1518-N6/adenine1519-N6)-dimethyltransferase